MMYSGTCPNEPIEVDAHFMHKNSISLLRQPMQVMLIS